MLDSAVFLRWDWSRKTQIADGRFAIAYVGEIVVAPTGLSEKKKNEKSATEVLTSLFQKDAYVE